jgi:TRAP-type C4-dicarboxylate transport system permease small subunit
MRVEIFDKLSAATISFVLGFSFGVAAASWNWFPTKGDWGHIAEIPPNFLSYVSLLAPWILSLVYLLLRRLYFKRPF